MHLVQILLHACVVVVIFFFFNLESAKIVTICLTNIQPGCVCETIFHPKTHGCELGSDTVVYLSVQYNELLL